jgi:hypothetical protein
MLHSLPSPDELLLTVVLATLAIGLPMARCRSALMEFLYHGE